jgi:C4-dicarboxylate transporter, DctM subunit
VITPPLGIAVFAVKGTLADRSVTVNDVFRGSLPFLYATFVLLALLVAAPGLATFLL